MGSIAQKNITDFVFEGRDITSLQEILFLSTLEKQPLDSIIDIKEGVYQGDKLGAIGKFGLVGKDMPLCNPVYNGTNLMTTLDKWELGGFAVAEKMCPTDYEGSIVEFVSRRGTDSGDYTGTEFLNDIIEPRLSEAVDDGLWRHTWLGDKDAKNIADGGVIADGLDLAYFNSIDGLFKRLFSAVPTTDVRRYVGIEANKATTKQKQLDDIYVTGVATGIFDKLRLNADPRLRQRKDKHILCTQSLFDALVTDIQRTNKGSSDQWRSLFDGFANEITYQGVKVIGLPIWDDMIQSFEGNADGTYNMPHRAVYAGKDMLWLGVNTRGLLLPDLRVFYVEKDNMTYIRGNNKIGTVLFEGDMISMAY